MTENHHSDYPILSVFFTAISGGITWMINNINLAEVDAAIIAPLAHLAAFGSGCFAIILAVLSIYERYFKKKKHESSTKKKV
jgi:hypothetical protein